MIIKQTGHWTHIVKQANKPNIFGFVSIVKGFIPLQITIKPNLSVSDGLQETLSHEEYLLSLASLGPSFFLPCKQDK